MTDILQWIITNREPVTVVGFGIIQTIILVVLLVASHRVHAMKKEMDRIVVQVKNYMDIVLENEEEELQKCNIDAMQKSRREEEENRIISSVLQEIFP